MREDKGQYAGYILTILYFCIEIFFQTKFSKRVLISIYDNMKFWYSYFDIMFYGAFVVALFVIYRVQILRLVKDIKKDYLKHIGIALVFIIITMVASAMILFYCLGIGESANQEAITESIFTNKEITLVVVTLIGPFVEEMIFRGVIYSFLRGKKKNVIRCILASVITSVLFALYHCDLNIFIELDVQQMLSVLPLFFMGIGLTYTQEKTSNLICPIITHIVINMFSLT